MINIAKERKGQDVALDSYRARLDTITDEQFTTSPPDGGWSFAEVYSHILQATLAASVGLERCTQKNDDVYTKGFNFVGWAILFFGRFPPVKVKVPESINAKIPAVKMSKEDAKNMIVKCRKRIEDITPLIKNSSPHSRNKHPRLGMLNAGQWFKFLRIHLEHHLKQLNRIENTFKNA